MFETKQLSDIELTATIREILTLAVEAKHRSRDYAKTYTTELCPDGCCDNDTPKTPEQLTEDERMSARYSGEYSGYVRVLSLILGIRSYLNVQALIKEWETH